jgi:hypothetical protein
MLIMLLMVLPITVVYCVVPMVVIVGVIEILVFLLMPLVLFYSVSNTRSCNCKPFAYFMLVILYPVIGGLFAIIALVVVLLYPFVRNKYHHGVYDPIDMLMLHMATFYLRAVNLLVTCCT